MVIAMFLSADCSLTGQPGRHRVTAHRQIGYPGRAPDVGRENWRSLAACFG
jgi:hypothetical protein